MEHLLNAEQRRQALAWYSTMGFSLENIAEHYGLDTLEVSRELNTARNERASAGKSPEPIPIKQPAGVKRTTQAAAYLEALNALEVIVWQSENMTPQAALNQIKATATGALKKAGRIL